MQLHMLLFLIECQSVIVPILFKLPSCAAAAIKQRICMRWDLWLRIFCCFDRLQRREPATIFFVSLSTSSIILYMKEKKIIISECISATDRNNEFQLRVLLLRDEMLLRSVFSVWGEIKDFSYSVSQKFEFSRQSSVFNFYLFYPDFDPFYLNFRNIRK